MAVVVTGGANGIGKATVEKLLEKDLDVIVIDNDAEAVEELDGVETHVADVREDEAAEILKDRDVEALINCAGFQAQGSVEDMELDKFDKHMQTNYIGTVRMVKACLPSIKENNGRIINIASMLGRMAIPFLGAYSASKHAVEGFSDALRMEMKDFDVDVVIIEPGPVKTGFNEEGAMNMENYLPDSEYADAYEGKVGRDFGGITADKAADAVLKAFEAKNPKARYRPTTKSSFVIFLKTLLPTWAYDRIARNV